MLSFSYLFARMYSRMSDSQVAVLSLHSDGKHLAIRVFDGSGDDDAVFEAFFTEAQVDDMKRTCSQQLTWSGFFELMQRTFAEHLMTFELSSQRLTLTVKHDRSTEALPFLPFSATIVVKLAREVPPSLGPSSPKRMSSVGIFLPQPIGIPATLSKYDRLCEEMISYASLRSGDSDEVDRLEQISKREARLSAQAAMLEAEVATLEAEVSCLATVRDFCAAVDRDAHEKNPTHRREIEASVAQAIAEDAFVDACWARAPDPLRPHVERNLGPLLAASGNYFKSLDGPLLQSLKGLYVGKDQHPLRCCDFLLTTTAPIFHGMMGATLENSTMSSGSISSARTEVRRRVWSALTAKLQDWNLDVQELHKDCLELPCSIGGSGGKAGALLILGYAIFFRTGLMSAFNLSERVLVQWLSMLEARHAEGSMTGRGVARAASALHAAFCLVSSSLDAVVRWRSDDVLALFMAACCVGLQHGDMTDVVHISTHSNAAVTFLDRFPNGAAAAFELKELMKLPRYDLLQCVTRDRRRDIETLVFSQLMRRSDDPFQAMEDSFSQLRCTLHALSSSSPSGVNSSSSDLTADELARSLLPSMLLACECCVFAKDRHQYQQWARLLQADLVRIGEQEQQAGVAVGPFHGRKAHNTSVFAKHQLRLINCVVAPLYSTLVDLAPALIRQTGELIGKNRSMWANAEVSEALGENSWR